MKNACMFLLMISSTGLLCSGHDLAGIQKKNVTIHQTDFNDEPITDATDMIGEETDDLEEYEQHVCDNVVPAKISPMQAYLTSILGSILIRAIIMKEVANKYFAALKQMVSNWTGSNN